TREASNPMAGAAAGAAGGVVMSQVMDNTSGIYDELGGVIDFGPLSESFSNFSSDITDQFSGFGSDMGGDLTGGTLGDLTSMGGMGGLSDFASDMGALTTFNGSLNGLFS